MNTPDPFIFQINSMTRLGLLFLLPAILLSMLVHGAAEDATYSLRPNDVIRLEVYQEPDLSTQVRILKTGEASFPLVGSVKISGLTVSEASEKIRDLYAKDYLVAPKLTLTVDEYATEFISVIGAVKNPGQVPMPVSGQMDLASAMASAGGLDETADANEIRLVRATGATSTFSMSAIHGEAGKVKLAAGDRIIVNQSPYLGKKVTVLGQVGRPGPLAFPLNGRLDIVTAVAMAGGITELANPRKVTINRRGQVTELNFKEVSQRGDQPILLQPDDVVTVAERLF